jgi:hypothetical protein
MPMEMQGKRVQNMPENPGEYYYDPTGKYTAGVPAVFFLKPHSRDPGVPGIARAIHHVLIPPHRLTEEPDGSITLRNSIGDTRGGGGESDGWHGWLTEGRWELSPSKP